MESKIKHLEFIQNIITRMNSNSFMLKAWTITLVSALFALAANGSNMDYVLVSYIAIPVFWILDGFYISQERQYRSLYTEVAKKNQSEIDFSLDATKYNEGKNNWISGILSKTLIPFYGVSIVATLIVMFLIK
jgi:hypothetical protein|tara:strand:+ start:1520 stop:1918 length:399 start_codon:yes stop_codon:yes gene_type:complete